MVDLLSAAQRLGVFDSPVEEVGSLARTMKIFRELQGPGPREKFDWQKQLDGYKTALGHMESIITNKNIDPASKEWTYQLLENMYYHADPVLRPAISALRGARYLSEEQRRVREFKKVYGERPQAPRDADGNPLPLTAENEFAHAQYRFQLMEYDYLAAGAAFGTDFAKMIQMPKALMINPPEETTSTEGKKSITGKVWYLDPQTKIPMSLPYQSIGMPSEQALDKWGWTVSRVLIEGQYPIGEAKELTMGGRVMRVQPMRNLVTGSDQMDRTILGSVDPEKVPKELAEVWAAAHLDLDTDKMQPWQQDLVGQLKEEVEFDDPREYFQRAEELNQALAPMLRGWKILPNVYTDEKGQPRIRGLKESRKHKVWSLADDRFYVDNYAWMIVPWTGDMVTVQDTFGNEGTFYEVKRKDGDTHLVSSTGEIVKNSRNARDGDIVEGVTFGAYLGLSQEEMASAEEQQREAAKFLRQSGAAVLDAVVSLNEWLNSAGTEEPIEWGTIPGKIKKALIGSMGEEKAKQLVEAWGKQYRESEKRFFGQLAEEQ